MEICMVEIERGYSFSDEDQLEDGEVVEGEW